MGLERAVERAQTRGMRSRDVAVAGVACALTLVGVALWSRGPQVLPSVDRDESLRTLEERLAALEAAVGELPGFSVEEGTRSAAPGAASRNDAPARIEATFTHPEGAGPGRPGRRGTVEAWLDATGARESFAELSHLSAFDALDEALNRSHARSRYTVTLALAPAIVRLLEEQPEHDAARRQLTDLLEAFENIGRRDVAMDLASRYLDRVDMDDDRRLDWSLRFPPSAEHLRRAVEWRWTELPEHRLHTLRRAAQSAFALGDTDLAIEYADRFLQSAPPAEWGSDIDRMKALRRAAVERR